ncbi:hypothetical protein V1264_015062 [Littorina saxatilis]
MDRRFFPAVVEEGSVFVTVCCEHCCTLDWPPCDISLLRFRFTFHQADIAAPQVLPNHQWNCSVPHWPDFQQHFACNLDPECEGGWDEADCPYNYCGAGDTSGSDTCYFMLWPARTGMTWDEANRMCQSEGAHLATMSSAEEWTTVTEALQARKQMVSVFVGLTTATSIPLSIYGRAAMWADNTAAYSVSYKTDISSRRLLCGFFDDRSYDVITLDRGCRDGRVQDEAVALCERNSAVAKDKQSKETIPLQYPENRQWPVPLATCSDGKIVLSFLPCGSLSRDTYVSESVISGSAQNEMNKERGPYFECRSGVQHLPYTLVCDHRHDCADNSDEDFCQFPPCTGDTPLKCGTSHQCISLQQWCDGQSDCYSGEDELDCVSGAKDLLWGKYVAIPPPALVHFDPTANTTSAVTMTTLTPSINDSYTCPDTHFQCPGGGYCMPVFVRCNGVNDCPGHEDEEGCSTYTCPGFYRCRNSRICLHADHVCDGLYHCPLQDDEQYCHIHCPPGCTCLGFASTCPRAFPVHQVPDLRYLDASDSGQSLQHLTHNVMLVRLGVARCGLTDFGNVTLPNLQSLDLSDNHVVSVSTGDLTLFPNLMELYLSGNPLTSILSSTLNLSVDFPFLSTLDVSRVYMKELKLDIFMRTPNLKVLNLSNNGIERIEGTFTFLTQLAVLDARQCPVYDFERNLLKNLQHFQELYAQNYKLCCPLTLPLGFNPSNCLAPFNEVSSCESLLRSDLYRILLSFFSASALLGNLGSLVFRLFVWKQSRGSGFGTFVSHLCVSDFVMGVYLAIIGLADRLYQGSYLWEDNAWRHSVACKVAGFLSLLSCEVSAFIVCFITLDRFLALRFPFSDFRFSSKASHMACAATWLLGVGVAAVPLLPATSHWQFYSQTGICIPLPITRNDFMGRSYSFGVMIVLNFVLFVLMAVGQVFIYTSIQSSRMSLGPDSSRKEQDVNIARRLITIAVTDFLCWFPIGLLGLLASRGVAVPGEVNVAMAILVLPLNSALNPFLYSLNMLLERRRRAQEQCLLQVLETQLLSESNE